MTAAHSETSSRTLHNEVVWVVAVTLCNLVLVYATVFLCYRQHVEESLCCIKV